jgi:hypothetical protein
METESAANTMSAIKININVNGEQAAVTSSGELRDVVQESFDMIGHSTQR